MNLYDITAYFSLSIDLKKKQINIGMKKIKQILWLMMFPSGIEN